MLHTLGTIVWAAGAVWAVTGANFGLALGFAGKSITYGASGFFHRFPFRTVGGVTAAFVADLLCVPFSACGSLPPFAEASDTTREVSLAAAVLALNSLCVLVQTRGQRGLRTPAGRSEAPRSAVVGLYTVWAFVFVGLRAGFGGAWAAMVVLAVGAVLLSQPVTAAHEEEPLSHRVPWHTPGVWSFHEDFHLCLAAADAAWVWLALSKGT